MGAFKGLIVRLRALARPSTADHELDAEMSFHVDRETEKNVALGMSPDEARRHALVAFGGVQQTREAHRGVRRAPWVEEIAADIRFALRTLRRSPALAGAAILTLALGIGANTAMFSAVNAVILRPLPFSDPGRLVMLWEENAERGWYKQTAAPANALDWREQVPAFADVAVYADFPSQTTLTEQGEPRLLTAAAVSGNIFSVLGVTAQAGRVFRTEETWDTGERVAVISDRLWREQLGGRTDVVGQTIQLGGRAVQVVGVTPAGFAFPWEDIDVWRPMAWPPASRTEAAFRRAHWVRPIARLRPGASLEQAAFQLREVAARLEQQHPDLNKAMGADLTPLHEFLVGDTRRPLLLLLGAVGLLLLIACANVGNLLLVQAAGRERETALRVALGAGRSRLVRQALTESLVLSVIGGAAGIALGWWATRALAALQPDGMLRVSTFGIDWTLLAYVFGITAGSGLLFGIAPAVWNGRRLPADALREGGRTGSESRRMRRWADGLVVGEVAVAVLLTVGAGLFVRSFREMRRIDPGFDPRGLIAVPVTLPGSRYDTGEKITAFYDAVLARLRTLPGVEAAAVARALPLTTPSWSSDFIAAGRPATESGTEVLHREVSPDYFRTMKVPLLSGRAFTGEDRPGAPNVVIINEALARSYFGGRSPIGERIAFDRVPDSASVWRTIVGVVGNEHQESLAHAARTEIFAPIAQDQTSGVNVVVRARCNEGACAPELLIPMIRKVVAELDPRLALGPPTTLTNVYEDSMARERFLMTLLLVFGGVGLSLAVVGVYGVLAQLARRRAREMGIRIALGAQRGQVRWLVVRHGMRLTTMGLVIGGAAALLSTRAVRGMLYGVGPGDPLTFLVVAAMLAATSLVASWLPALKASRADPAVTLRGE